MKVFLAGIMQGSHVGAVLHNQEYRERLRTLLADHLPEAEVYDPLADHANSLEYDEGQGRDVFFAHNRMCRLFDVVLAFVPQATMGTAIEMWEAHQHGRIVITVSPLVHNWTVRFCSDHVFPDLESFEAALRSGGLREQIEHLRVRKRARA